MGKGSRYAGVERYQGKEGVRWVGRASKRLPDGGRVHWEESHGTEAGAYRARRDWMAAQEGGRAPVRTKATLADALRTWLDTHVPHLEPASQRLYGDIVRLHIMPAPIASVALQRLDAATIQAWYNTLTADSDHMRRSIHARMRQALDLAVRHNLIADNPARRCEVPKHESHRGVAFTDEQVAAFLAVADVDHYRPFWQVAIATGLRRGEMLGLRWRDVDLERGTLTVRQTLTWVRAPELKPRGKTPSSLRSMVIGPGVVALLRNHRMRQSVWRARAGETWLDTGAIFSTRKGNYLSPPDMVRAKKGLMEKAGLPHTLRIHDMRHTAMSYQLNHGVPIATVAARGGYKNAGVLLAVYAHADQDGHIMAAGVADGLIAGGGEVAGKYHPTSIQ